MDLEPEKDDIYQLPSTLFHPLLQRYEGETSEGLCHGNGVAYFHGGHIYTGVFAKGLMDGPGVFTWGGGLKYEGEFVCNKPMGQGTYTWPDGGTYKGEVYDGVRHGTGTYECAKSVVTYTGQWVQGKRHGKGEVFYDQSKTSWYKGDWVMNSREGFGVRCYLSGNIYTGQWRNNLRHGEGTMSWLQLRQEYVGMWQDGVQHGRGTHIWMLRQLDGSQYSQNNQYMGDFVMGQRHGWGTLFYAGGAVYEGELRNDKKHGKGKFTFKDGHVFEGEFVDDQMVVNELKGALPPPVLVADMANGLSEVEDSEKIVHTSSSAHSVRFSLETESQQDVETKVCEEPQSAVHREEHGAEETQANDQTIHQQLVTELMEEEKLCQEVPLNL